MSKPTLTERQSKFLQETRLFEKKKKDWKGRKRPKNHVTLNPKSDYVYEALFAEEHKTRPPTQQELLEKEHRDYLRAFHKSLGPVYREKRLQEGYTL